MHNAMFNLLYFQDTYANLTIKDIIAFDYGRQHAGRYKYFAIAGDEVMLDIPGKM